MKKLLFLLSFITLLNVEAQINKNKYNFNGSIQNVEKRNLQKKIFVHQNTPLSYIPSAIEYKESKPRILLSKPGSGIEVLQINEQGIPSVLQVEARAHKIESLSSEIMNTQLKELLNLQSDKDIKFEIKDKLIDELGTDHIRLSQFYKNIPLIDVEFLVHKYKDGSLFLNGSAFRIINDLPIEAKLLPEQISEICIQKYGLTKIENSVLQNITPTGVLRNSLGFWQDPSDNQWKLIYFVKYRPNISSLKELYIDASTGQILSEINPLCNFVSHECFNHNHNEELAPMGAETATANDLFNKSQTINVWKEGSTYYMSDASKPMFNASRSKFPDNTVGTITTLDAKNRNVEGNSFSVDHITSTNNTWPSQTAVSAHINGSKAYEYFRQTHIRNSIDGVGGNIYSIINVRDNGGNMDNAFWNGEAMFYGNGNSAFSPLAKGLDVAGHEMSHGVIGSTANLVYQNESGAINESYADIFGALIDRDDWKMGEDVVNTSVFRSGALRDLSDPHNGGTSLNTPGYQPRHVNEQYKGTEDEGGVHINSGIPNYAFYNFVTELSKTKGLDEAKKIGERVYYHALTKFLTRSSNFKDLRTAIEKCAMDLYSSTPEVLSSVKFGFDRVGIGSSSGGPNPGTRVLQTNPGKEFIVCTDGDKFGLYLYDFQTQPITISNRLINSKPSVTDNGAEIYVVGADKRIYGYFRNGNGVYVEAVIDDQPVYRNAVISKDGNLIAVVYDLEENFIHVYDFISKKWGDFKLVNPTTGGTNTGDVRYADVMDFDHSGQYIMYDAFNVIKNSSGQNYEYWDIGFVNVYNTASKTFAAGKIDKLVQGLQENAAIGNPVFSKNSLDVIAFDYISEGLFGAKYDLYGANIETGTFEIILEDRPDLSYPNFSVKDNNIIFDGLDNNSITSINGIGLSSSKITASGNEQTFLRGGKWGAWFAVGTRKLTIGFNNIVDDKSIEVYPNPFEDNIVIKLDLQEATNAIFEFSNTMGQVVLKQNIKDINPNVEYVIPTDQLNSGVYILNIVTEDGKKESLKLIRK